MRRRCFPGLTTMFAIFGLIASAAQAGTVQFNSAILLETPVGVSKVEAFFYQPTSAGFGAAGYQFVDTLGPVQAVRWAADGSLELLGDVPNHTTVRSEAHAINDIGQAAGYAALFGFANRAVRWEADGSATLLGDVPNHAPDSSFAYSINAAGQVAGFATLSGANRAVRWDADGSATQLAEVPNQTAIQSFAYSLNDAGQVAGYANLSGVGGRAIRWAPDGSAEILGMVDGYLIGEVHDINSAGEVVGHLIKSRSPTRAVLWAEDGTATLLDQISGSSSNFAYGIADSGHIAGHAFMIDVSDNRAVIWDAAGSPSLLQDLMSDGNAWTFTRAYGIDSNAATLRVLAFGSKNGEPDAWYMLNAAIPEPTSLALLAIAAPLALRRMCRASR